MSVTPPDAAPIPPLTVHAQYVKDLSFENPRSPHSLMEQGQPQLGLNVLVKTRQLEGTTYEVALVHTALALPTTVLITSSIFVAVPQDLEEAALTLGCTPVGAFLRVALPLALPGLAAASIFTFVLSWNEVFAATILTVSNRTLPAQVFGSLGDSPLPFRFAGGFALIVPSLIFIFFIRRYLFNMWGRVTR